MDCKYCGATMEKFDDEGGLIPVPFDDYICPVCLAGCYRRDDKEEWGKYSDWKFSNRFRQAVSHLINWKSYTLAKKL